MFKSVKDIEIVRNYIDNDYLSYMENTRDDFNTTWKKYEDRDMALRNLYNIEERLTIPEKTIIIHNVTYDSDQEVKYNKKFKKQFRRLGNKNGWNIKIINDYMITEPNMIIKDLEINGFDNILKYLEKLDN